MARGGARSGSGRKRTDPALKLLGAAAIAPVTVPGAAPKMTPPLHLSDHEQLLFGTIVELLEARGNASVNWTDHVALLAVRLAQAQRLKAVLEVEGDTYQTKTSTGGLMIRARPEVAMMSEAMRQVQSLLGELMLNPSAALKIAEGHKKPAGDFDDF